MTSVNGKHCCARRSESFHGAVSPGELPDTWREDGSCSYCGSLNPDTFLKLVEEGVLLGPTDKNYKVYLDGAGMKQTYRNCPRDAKCTGPDDCTHWVTRDVDRGKFYFQHLNAEQRTEFIRLLNLKGVVRFSYPGYFYVLPFFLDYVTESRGALDTPPAVG